MPLQVEVIDYGIGNYISVAAETMLFHLDPIRGFPSCYEGELIFVLHTKFPLDLCKSFQRSSGMSCPVVKVC